MICRGLCAYNEMLWMCVLYMSFRCKVKPRTLGCIVMGSAMLFIFISRFYFVQAKTLCRYGCYLYVFLGCTRAYVCKCDGDAIFIGHDLNWCSWWCYVCSVNVEYCW